ncbi:MAG: protein kinase [Proteobacteria bacterium]|nr:protein kinase [Pseudomonadota bacterium]
MKPLPSVQPPLFELGPYVADEVVEVTDLCVVFRADSEHGPVALHIPRASLQGDLEFRALWSSALDGADGQVGGRSSVLWRAAPWVEGRTLSTLLRRLRSRGGRLGLQDSLAIGVEIARQLDAIHQAGSWHGRLDADRVLIGVDGAVHLLGHPAPALFCSAALLAERTVLQVARMPPEQVDLAGGGRAADVYRLALLVLELVSGSNPLVRQTVARTERAVLEGLEWVHVDGAHPDMLSYLTAALSVHPQSRPQAGLERVWQQMAGVAGSPVGPERRVEILRKAFGSGAAQRVAMCRPGDQIEVKDLIRDIHRMTRVSGAVHEAHLAQAPPPPVSVAPPPLIEPVVAPVVAPATGDRRRVWPFVLVAVALLGAVLMALLWAGTRGPAETPAEAAPRVVVVEAPAPLEPESAREQATAPVVEPVVERVPAVTERVVPTRVRAVEPAADAPEEVEAVVVEAAPPAETEVAPEAKDVGWAGQVDEPAVTSARPLGGSETSRACSSCGASTSSTRLLCPSASR